MSLLIFGATGKTGKYAVDTAIQKGDRKIVCFVRNASKIPAEQRDKVTIIEGDYLDEKAVKNAVIESKPSSIIVTAAVPIGSPLTPFNEIVMPRIVDALQQENRLKECSIIYLSGAFAKVPDQNLGYFLTILGFFFVPYAGIQALVADNTATLKYLFSTPPELKFSSVQMGNVYEGESKGKIKVKGSGSSVTYADVGAFLVELAYDNSSAEVSRKGFLIGY